METTVGILECGYIILGRTDLGRENLGSIICHLWEVGTAYLKTVLLWMAGTRPRARTGADGGIPTKKKKKEARKIAS